MIQLLIAKDAEMLVDFQGKKLVREELLVKLLEGVLVFSQNLATNTAGALANEFTGLVFLISLCHPFSISRTRRKDQTFVPSHLMCLSHLNSY